MNTSSSETMDIEELLASAGVEFTVVERCPYPKCEVCVGKDLSAAA